MKDRIWLNYRLQQVNREIGNLVDFGQRDAGTIAASRGVSGFYEGDNF